MRTYLPKVNAKWDAHSAYSFQPYFVEQKARTSGGEAKPANDSKENKE